MDQDDENSVGEVTFDYSDQNNGKTHMLVIEFPEAVGEKAFLTALKFYIKAQMKSLQRTGNREGMI